MDDKPNDKLGAEIQRRRTFAIISHPDAGKTTLTESFAITVGIHRVTFQTARKDRRCDRRYAYAVLAGEISTT